MAIGLQNHERDRLQCILQGVVKLSTIIYYIYSHHIKAYIQINIAHSTELFHIFVC